MNPEDQEIVDGLRKGCENRNSKEEVIVTIGQIRRLLQLYDAAAAAAAPVRVASTDA